MTEYRIKRHPILSVESSKSIAFYWQGQPLTAKEGEMIASALFANGVETFGHHSKDGAPQGIFCANGQCSQCLVIADGVPVKACMKPVEAGMRVEPSTGLPDLPKVGQVPSMSRTESIAVPVLIIGGGLAGKLDGKQRTRTSTCSARRNRPTLQNHMCGSTKANSV